MKTYSTAFMLYGELLSGRNALTEEKYKDLADAFLAAGFQVRTVLYSDEAAEAVYKDLLTFDAVLVWINPIEQGRDRKKLDALLANIAAEGCFVSTHPEVILKMGTKDVLYKTKDMAWGSPTNLYTSYQDFRARFPESLQKAGIKVLKQYRGNGGNGVYKIRQGASADLLQVTHAKNSLEVEICSWQAFFSGFEPYFSNDGMLIEQAWNDNLQNGMVRCYLSGNSVAGFGYQEINALYELSADGVTHSLPPGKRYYFTRHCGLFSDLKEVMENNWVPLLQKSLSIPNEMLPVIWDADFFINDIHGSAAAGKYTLCEINVSCVSPFPPGAIPFIVDEVKSRLAATEARRIV
jgi:hypothetical protein